MIFLKRGHLIFIWNMIGYPSQMTECLRIERIPQDEVWLISIFNLLVTIKVSGRILCKCDVKFEFFCYYSWVMMTTEIYHADVVTQLIISSSSSLQYNFQRWCPPLCYQIVYIECIAYVVVIKTCTQPDWEWYFIVEPFVFKQFLKGVFHHSCLEPVERLIHNHAGGLYTEPHVAWGVLLYPRNS